MPLVDPVTFSVQKYSSPSNNQGVYYKDGDGIFGISSGDGIIWISKTDEVGNKLWDAPVLAPGANYYGGVVLVTDDRIYFRDRSSSPQRIVWIPYTSNPIPDYPPLTTVISYGPGAQDLHGSNNAWWCGTLYGTQYIFHCDRGAHRIVVTDLDGNYIGEFGTYGSGLGELNSPIQVCVIYPDMVGVVEYGNRRVSFWEIKSWSPFVAQMVVGGVESSQLISEDYYPIGVAAWKDTQLYVMEYKPSYLASIYVTEFKINSDLSTTKQGSYYYSHDSNTALCAWAGTSKLVTSYKSKECRVYGLRVIDSGLSETMTFDIYAMISGVGVDINFDLISGSPQALMDAPFEIDAEARTQINEFDENFFFSLTAKAGPYNMISEFGFDLVAGEHGIRQSFGFELFAGQNHLEDAFGFELYTETSTIEFSTVESSFGFELLAGAPCSGGLSLELETLELHSKAAADIIGTCQFLLESLVVEAYEGPTSELVLPALEVEASISVPSTGVSQLILPELSVVASASVPSVASMVLELEGLSAEGQALIHGQLNGAVVLPSLVTQGIMSMGAASAQISAVVNNLKVNSWGAVVPSITGALVLPSLAVSSSQSIQLYSISELYDGNSLIHIPGADYYQIDLSSFSDLEENLFDVQGLAINLGTKAVTKLGHPATYNVIDLGYLDVHKVAVMDYLIVYLYGDMSTEEDSVGQLVIGDYSYEIKRWVTNGEWRVVIGKGLTKQSFRGPSVRYQRILLQLKDGFELKGITILATPNPRRLR